MKNADEAGSSLKNDSEDQVPACPELDFSAIFDRYIAQNQKVWKHDRSTTVGASEVFNCLRSLVYDKRHREFKIEPPDASDQKWGAMERGNIIENAFVVPGLHAGLPPELHLELAGEQQDTLVLDRNSATPDGIITGLKPGPLRIKGCDQDIFIPDIRSDCIALEIKSIDPRVPLLEEKARHHGQSQVQLGIIRELTPYKPFFAVVLYIDASFIDKITPFVVEFNPDIYAEAKRRAHDVWSVNDPMMVVPEGRFTGQCEKCRWAGPCNKQTLASIPAASNELEDPTAIDEMDPLVREYLRLKKEHQDAEALYEQAKERIKEALMDFKVRKVDGPEWGVTWFPVKGKTYLDQDAVKAAGIDLTPFYRSGDGHDQLRVTPRLPKKPKSSSPRKRKTSDE